MNEFYSNLYNVIINKETTFILVLHFTDGAILVMSVYAIL